MGWTFGTTYYLWWDGSWRKEPDTYWTTRPVTKFKVARIDRVKQEVTLVLADE